MKDVQLNKLDAIDFRRNLRGHKNVHLSCLENLLKPKKEKLEGPPLTEKSTAKKILR